MNRTVSRSYLCCLLHRRNMSNLQLLRDMGAEPVFFSPLKDRALPDCDGLLLCGGYPELHLQELSENKAMREATEKVQENLNKLKDSKNLSADERSRLKKETMDAIDKMDKMTDQYIRHASPNGKEPSTAAGKERLAGARELKEFSKSMKERFAADPDVQIEMKKEQEANG